MDVIWCILMVISPSLLLAPDPTDPAHSDTAHALVDHLSRFSDDFTPGYLWNLDATHHSASGSPNTLYAILHDATLTSGPVYSSGDPSGAVEFQGIPTSFMEVQNVNGSLDATSVFTWAMVVHPSCLANYGVIMEYRDGIGLVQILQRGKHATATAVDTAGTIYSLEAADVFKDFDWVFLCLTFYNGQAKNPKLKLYYSDYLEEKPSKKEEVTVSEKTTLHAFSGTLSCLRYHAKYVEHFHDDNTYPLQCDPDGIFPKQHNMSEYTMDYVESTTSMASTLPTVETSTKLTTTQITTMTTEKPLTSAGPMTTEELTTHESSAGTSVSAEEPTTPTVSEKLTSPDSMYSTGTFTIKETTTATSNEPTTEELTTHESSAGTSVSSEPTTPTVSKKLTSPDSTGTFTIKETTTATSNGLTSTNLLGLVMSGGGGWTASSASFSTDDFTTATERRTTSSEGQTICGMVDSLTTAATTVWGLMTTSGANGHDFLTDTPDICFRLVQQPGYINSCSDTAILDQTVAASLSACARLCAESKACGSIAVETKLQDDYVPGLCLLLAGKYQGTATTGLPLVVYHLG